MMMAWSIFAKIFIDSSICQVSHRNQLIMTSWNGNIFRVLALCAGNPPIPVNSPHKGQWRGALMFSLICAWINCWVNNREASDLGRQRGRYDVIVMETRYQQIRNISINRQFGLRILTSICAKNVSQVSITLSSIKVYTCSQCACTPRCPFRCENIVWRRTRHLQLLWALEDNKKALIGCD